MDRQRGLSRQNAGTDPARPRNVPPRRAGAAGPRRRTLDPGTGVERSGRDRCDFGQPPPARRNRRVLRPVRPRRLKRHVSDLHAPHASRTGGLRSRSHLDRCGGPCPCAPRPAAAPPIGQAGGPAGGRCGDQLSRLSRWNEGESRSRTPLQRRPGGGRRGSERCGVRAASEAGTQAGHASGHVEATGNP